MTQKIQKTGAETTAKNFVVTPWEVSGEVDYNKLVEEFGIEPINDPLLNRIKKHTGELHLLLRRKVFFAHRDINWLLDEYEKGNKFFLYTGRASSNERVHLGHLVPWIFTKWLQDKFDCELWFQFPDEEKFLFKKNLSLEDTKKGTYEDALDVIALGFNPNKTKFLIDTKNAKLMYKEACKVAKRITFSTAKAAFGFTNETNIGSIFYTAMQAVPAFLPSIMTGKNIPCLIPLGADQDPHFRISRDVIPKLGYSKPALIHCKFMPGLEKGGKMSASDPNTAIFVTDKSNDVNKKIANAFTGGRDTLKEQMEKGGRPEICPVFQYYIFLFELDDKELAKRETKCRSGKLVCGDCKKELAKRINLFLEDHMKKREKAKKILDKFIVKD